MTFIRLAAVLATALLLGMNSHEVRAQSPLDKFLAEDHVKESLETALKNIQKGKCEDEKPCAPATKEELKNPPVSIENARGAIKAGVISGTMQWCGLSWEARNFKPFLLHHKNNEGMNQRQLAIMALIHGFHQAAVRKQFENTPCPAETKKQMSSQLPLEAIEKPL